MAAALPLDDPFLSHSQYRAGLALAEAIIPGSRTVPAADEETFARAQQVVREFHPAAARAWGLALQTLDAAAIARKGRPFHALGVDDQEQLIERWQRDPALRAPLGLVALVYKLVHFDRPDVYGRMGGTLNVVRDLDQPRWLSQIHRAETWPAGNDVECDVVVVGTGAGGAVVGRELAERGYAVVFVEEGEHHRRDAFDGSSVRAHKRFYRAAFSVGNASIPIFVGRLVGGSTAINGGTCFRTPSWVLDRWCEENRTDELSPRAMAPYFERVERFLEVGPSPRAQIGPIADFMARGCDALGWSHFAVQRNAPGCNGLGFCNFGCRTDARKGTNLSYVPAALQKGAVALTGARVDRVLVEVGRAVGVQAVAGGRALRVRGRAVVLAGGAIPTPLLLLGQGLANSSGQVGRNLSLHPSTGFAAYAPEPIHPATHIPQGYGCDEFLRDGILILAAQPDVNVSGVVFPYAGRRLMDVVDRLDRLAVLGVMIRDAGANGRVWREVGGLPAITYTISAEDVRRMHQALVYAGEMSIAAGATRLYPLLLGAEPIEGARGLDAFRKATLKPGDFVWTSYHPLGTCKMGRDPQTSVVGLDHQTHDVRGLYVVDGSTVGGPIGVNPQLTIMAMATRAADKIAEQLG
jgi:choline dehydrogenase-like flavoprotein